MLPFLCALLLTVVGLLCTELLSYVHFCYQALVAATREIGLEVSADKTKYMVMSRDQKAGRSHRIKTDNK